MLDSFAIYLYSLQLDQGGSSGDIRGGPGWGLKVVAVAAAVSMELVFGALVVIGWRRVKAKGKSKRQRKRSVPVGT